MTADAKCIGCMVAVVKPRADNQGSPASDLPPAHAVSVLMTGYTPHRQQNGTDLLEAVP